MADIRGLILVFAEGYRGEKEPRFWRLFGAVRNKLDSMYWCFPCPPWMGGPDAFDEERALVDFGDEAQTSITLWKPGSLSKYADKFEEEEIQLWGMAGNEAHAKEAAKAYAAAKWKEAHAAISQYADVWLHYTDSTCWEFISRDHELIDQLRDSLERSSIVRIYPTSWNNRKECLAKALGRESRR